MSNYGHSTFGGNLDKTTGGAVYSSQKISLSDLTNTDHPFNLTNTTATTATAGGGSLYDGNNPSMMNKSIDYKKELSKLLTKSRGTAYENTLRRFVETKLREIGRDMEEKKSQGNTPKKLDLFSLSTSKYDSPHRNAIRESILKIPEIDDTEIKKKRLEDMSQPLDRNKYKGPDENRVSTNHLGRQRPPPKGTPTSSPYRNTRSASPSVRSVTSASSHVPRAASRSGSRSRHQPNHDPYSVTSSPTEFRSWYRGNLEWDEIQQQKVREIY